MVGATRSLAAARRFKRTDGASAGDPQPSIGLITDAPGPMPIGVAFGCPCRDRRTSMARLTIGRGRCGANIALHKGCGTASRAYRCNSGHSSFDTLACSNHLCKIGVEGGKALLIAL